MSQSQTQTMTKLDFREALLPSGKRDTTDALLKRLKTLHSKLAVLEQDYTDVRSLDPVRKPLIHQTILHHKDRGVKAYAACCLADLLRLYAPDAPYQPSQLRDIFQFISAQITLNLKPAAAPPKPLQPSKNKSNEASQTPSQSQTQLSQRITDVPYYTEYFNLLENLATIKSVVLICDAPGSEELIEGFFTGFMEIARPDMSKTVMRHLRDILVVIVEEATSLPDSVMDCLIHQFETYASRPETPSFQLTVEVCNQVADKLKRPVFAHFSEIQLAHGRDPSPNDLKTLTESHELLLTVYRFCPALLLNVVPLLEENLKAADETPLRQLTVKTIGAMFGQRSGAEDPAKKFPQAWRAWMGRKQDKAYQVRQAWVEGTRGVLVNHPESRIEIEEALIDRLQDSDERIRAAVCKVVETLDYESALHHLDVKLLQAVATRMSDKKPSVRSEALQAMSKLWNLAYSEIEARDSEVVAQFGWIPEAMLHCLFKKEATLEMRAQISVAFKSTILPLPQDADDEQAWTDRLLLVASHLDEAALKALDKLTNLPAFSKGSSPFVAFVTFCEANNGGVIENDAAAIKERLNFVIDAIAKSLGDHEKARKDLQAFADGNDARLYKLYRATVDINSNLASIIKSRNELLRRIHQSHTEIEETFTSLVELASWNLINHSSIPPLIKRLQRPESDEVANTAAHFLALIAKDGAPMYKTHVQELQVVMGDKKNEKLVEVALQGLAAAVKIYPDLAPVDKKIIERATHIVMEGRPRQAKFAARYLARSKDLDASDQLIDRILKALKKKDDSHLLSHLRALSELALSASRAFEAKSEDIIKYVMEEVMLVVSPSQQVEGDEWVPEETLEKLDRAKLLGLRICTHWCLSYARDSGADKAQALKPALTLLTSVLSHDGMVNEDTLEGGSARCHMRLRASLCLLKLANVKAFDKAITQPTQFELVAGTVQLMLARLIGKDPCYMVRHLFLRKLGEVLPTLRLLPRWNLMPALVAMDPDQDNINLGRMILTSLSRIGYASQEQRVERIELPLARLLHLLTHHPDFQWEIKLKGEGEGGEEDGRSVQEGIADMQNLKDIARFIELFLDCVANRENIGLLFAIAGGLKTVRDRFDNNSKPLYSLSELAQIIIRNRAEKHAWTVPVYPGKIKMPSDIFHHHDTPEDQRSVQRTQFLNEEARSWARGLGRRQINAPGTSTQKRERVERERTSSSPARKRQRTKKPRRKVKEETDSELSDEEEEDEYEEEDDEDEEGSDTAVEDGEEVLGRGGRRGAKTKAKRAVKKRTKKVKKSMEVDDEGSDLTEMDE